MGTMDDVLKLDATGQAGLVRAGEITAKELVQAAADAVEAVNPTLNAVIMKTYEDALAAADDPGDGPFAGVPYLIKDIGAMLAGVPMTLGTRLLKSVGFMPDHDSELTRRLKRAGFVVLGKTNTPELGLLPTTEPWAHGPTKNPWDTTRTPGGSSGGSAAAVASRMVAAAHANDGGGSIRIPASCCGLFGMKPTRARNPLGPDFGDMMSGLIIEHAVTRSVRDSAAILDATSGPDTGDPYWAPPPARPFAEEVGAAPGKLRIGMSTESLLGGKNHDDCKAAVEAAANLCETLGHTVERIAFQPSVEPASVHEAFMVLWCAGCASTIETIGRSGGFVPLPEHFEPLTWAVYEHGRLYSASDYLGAVALLQRVSREVARSFTDYDVLLTPVLTSPPVPLGSFDCGREGPWAAWHQIERFAAHTALFNATGQPAMSVPLYWTADGLPVGSQFIGRFGDEATLFRLAAQLEEARPWAGRLPPVCAV